MLKIRVIRVIRIAGYIISNPKGQIRTNQDKFGCFSGHEFYPTYFYCDKGQKGDFLE